MKIICLQENLEKALSFINRTAVIKTQLPLTTNVLIKATKEGIEIAGTDLENTTRVTLLGKVEKEGGILLPTRTLIETVSALPKEQILMEAVGLATLVKGGRYEVKIHGISADEFPEPKLQDGEEKLAIDDVLPHIKEVALAAAIDESRASLTGVLVLFQKNGLSLVATDGYRLSMRAVTVANGEVKSERQTVIVPARILLEVAKIYEEQGKGNEEKKEAFLLFQGNNQVAFFLDNVKIFTRLIGGEFPTYEKIIPQSFDTRVVFDKDEFVSAVKLSSVFARESANIVKIQITKKGLMLSANAPQIGENRCDVEGALDGDENEIAFNSRFLMDFLGAVNSKEIAFEMTGPLNPGVFKIPGDDSYLHIIMPVRVQG